MHLSVAIPEGCDPGDIRGHGAGIDTFRYIKIQPKTIDLSTRLMGIVCGVYSQEPRIEVYRLRLNFNTSKLVYF